MTKLIPNKTVCRQHSGSMPESWIGTEVSFQLEAEENQKFVSFTHSDWEQAIDFMVHCNTKWAVFLLSLKDALETGKWKPFPNDAQMITRDR